MLGLLQRSADVQSIIGLRGSVGKMTIDDVEREFNRNQTQFMGLDEIQKDRCNFFYTQAQKVLMERHEELNKPINDPPEPTYA